MGRLVLFGLALLVAAISACDGAARPNIDYERLRGQGYAVEAVSGTPAVSMERAVALAAADSPGYATQANAISATYVLLTTDTQVCREGERDVRCRAKPVWLITMEGVEIPPMICGKPGGEPTPYDPERCPSNHEWNAFIDAATGERLFEFTYR
jgi:hypothetical protein